MSSYRPVMDSWFLARPKVKYYGAYPSGFLERARWMVGSRYESCLHVCGGHAKDYPNWMGLCFCDYTLDLDPACAPDFLQPAMAPLPDPPKDNGAAWSAILCDPPYTDADADHYVPGRAVLPGATELLRHALKHVRLGGRVGMLHYLLPRPPAEGVKFLASAAVYTGYGNRPRTFSLFERTR